MTEPTTHVPRRIAAVIVNSLKGGVVPRVGLPYVTVGREREIQALLHDLELVADGVGDGVGVGSGSIGV